MKRLFLTLALALSCATSQQQAAPLAQQTPQAQQAQPAKRARRLTVVAINDTHGALLEQPRPRWLTSFTDAPVGGADWFAGYLSAIRSEAAAAGATTVLLDAGDLFQGTLISNQFRGRSL